VRIISIAVQHAHCLVSMYDKTREVIINTGVIAFLQNNGRH